MVDTQHQLIPTCKSKNHFSAHQFSDQVEKRLREEIEDGNYKICSESQVTLISPLSVVPKPDGDIRLIHDLSFPKNNSLNDFASKEPCIYEDINAALQIVSPNCWMAKCDLKWAYRSVPIHKDHQQLTGLQWTFKGEKEPTTLIDTSFCFGARKSPAHFNRITQSIKRMMNRRGFNCIVFLDDFLLSEQSFEKCALALKTLIALLRSLGFRINYKKVIDPTQNIVFLGYQIDTVQNRLSLDPSKVNEIKQNIQQTVVKKRISRKQLEKLNGQLTWATNVIPYARVYVTALYDALSRLKHPTHKTLLTACQIRDLEWWCRRLSQPTCRRPIWAQPRNTVICSTDSCVVAGGAFCHSIGDWCYMNWLIDKPELAHVHINVKELAAIRLAIERWGHLFPNCNMLFYTDNLATNFWINRWNAKYGVASQLLKEIATLAEQYRLSVSCAYIPGAHNHTADAISRLHQNGQLLRLQAALSLHGCPSSNIFNHMSAKSALFLSPQVVKFHQTSHSWIWKSPRSDATAYQRVHKPTTDLTSKRTSHSANITAYRHFLPLQQLSAGTLHI